MYNLEKLEISQTEILQFFQLKSIHLFDVIAKIVAYNECYTFRKSEINLNVLFLKYPTDILKAKTVTELVQKYF